MTSSFEPSITELCKYIEEVVPSASATRVGKTNSIEVRSGDQRKTLTYSSDQLDDLEGALTNGALPKRYRNGIVRDMKLRSLVAIGREGMAPDVDILKLILNEDLEWKNALIWGVQFDTKTSKNLYQGLKSLDSVAEKLTDSGIHLPDVEKEREVMRSMINFYEKQKHLNSPEVRAESFSYLKAAALCWLLDVEQQKASTPSARLRRAHSIRLYDILEQFWLLNPFDRIKLPPIIQDYIAQRTQDSKIIATELVPSLDIGPQLKRLDPRLEERWHGAWKALQSDNPDKVSQAANSMVEVLDQVIAKICDGKEFKEVLAERFPKQQDLIASQRGFISALKQSLHAVKHETNAQTATTAQDLIHFSEGIIRMLLR